ncbi:hypothetical protein NDU88_001683 [Pleurodeles waltl]|uniref:Uncharacterized protein n=1 Tax=Pleurodeles waltl TaxID=8319 RepID=A0AAV7TKU9_PLEWA|nr:hypothetical protein NDU88_001683 [Pleurodeles waltl]
MAAEASLSSRPSWAREESAQGPEPESRGRRHRWLVYRLLFPGLRREPGVKERLGKMQSALALLMQIDSAVPGVLK